MKNEKDIPKELEELSPLLAKMKREQPQTGFSVPPTYFKNLPAEIMEQVAPTVIERKPTWWESLLQQLALLLQPRMAMTLATCALLLVGIWYLNIETTQTMEPVANEALTLEDLEQYVAANLDDFNEEMLLEYQTETPVLDLEIEEIPDSWLDDLDTEDLL